MAIPVVLITGFLGSGKTTLLNHLLRRSRTWATPRSIINEFGDVAIDHLLVGSAIENAVVLQSGCICCTVRGDLVDTLDDLCAKVARGELPPFSRIAIETTGLADPASLVRAFLTERLLAERFTLRAVVTTVDAVNGAGQLDEFEEARHQAALADVVVLTKSGPRLARGRCRSHGPAQARRILQPPSSRWCMAPSPRTRSSPWCPRIPRVRTTRCWRGSTARRSRSPDGHAHSHHDNRIKAFAVTLDQPVTREALRGWLRSVLSLRGANLLRMKGIVALKGEAAPIVVHAVQNALYPPVQLASWPSDDRTTRIVFITRDIAPEALRNSLEVLASRGAA